MGRNSIRKKRPRLGQGQESCVTTVKLYLGLGSAFRIHTATHPLPELNNVYGVTFFLHLYCLMFVTVMCLIGERNI